MLTEHSGEWSEALRDHSRAALIEAAASASGNQMGLSEKTVHLYTTTIQDLMMSMCTTNFELEEQQLAFYREYLSEDEIQEGIEEKDAQQDNDREDLEPVSANEEDDIGLIYNHSIDQIASQNVSNKRQRGASTEADREELESCESDDESELPLPRPLHEESNIQKRMSGSARKCSRLLEGYELGRG